MIVYEELWAFALYQACRFCGIRIPADLSVVAFDDIYAVTAYPAMTVISLELFDLGVRAMEIAADLSESGRAVTPADTVDEYIPTRLIVRKSTGPVPGI
jgi:DNA-binding LacI/PurR family transcriptional regulator